MASSSPSTTTKPTPLTLAILDDYSNTAPTHFSHIPNLQITSFPKTLNPNTPQALQALISRLEPFDIISSMRERTPFPAPLVAALPNLKLLLSSGHRNAALDLPALSARGVPVTGTKGDRRPATGATSGEDFEPPPPEGYSAVNQHAWALLLALCGRIPYDDRALKVPGGTSWQSGMGISLGGKTLGLLGLGKLGTAMGKVAVQSFGMKVIAWSENLTAEKAAAAAQGCGLQKGEFEVVESKGELFRRADVVSLHLVLSGRSQEIVGREELKAMKKGAVLVNTSRAGLVDEEALVEVLREGRIGGFATDVFWEEPLGEESVWRRVDEWAKSAVVLSPHMGYVNAGTMNRWYQEQAENLERWLRGDELLNRMN